MPLVSDRQTSPLQRDLCPRRQPGAQLTLHTRPCPAQPAFRSPPPVSHFMTEGWGPHLPLPAPGPLRSLPWGLLLGLLSSRQASHPSSHEQVPSTAIPRLPKSWNQRESTPSLRAAWPTVQPSPPSKGGPEPMPGPGRGQGRGLGGLPAPGPTPRNREEPSLPHRHCFGPTLWSSTPRLN